MKDIVYIILLLLLSGCTKMVYIPVESTRTEYRDILMRDSIHTRDSILIMLKGDTVWMEKYRTIYRDRLRIDSIFFQDSIQVPYPVEKIVYRNKTAWYQDFLIYVGLGAIGILMLWLIKRKM